MKTRLLKRLRKEADANLKTKEFSQWYRGFEIKLADIWYDRIAPLRILLTDDEESVTSKKNRKI